MQSNDFCVQWYSVWWTDPHFKSFLSWTVRRPIWHSSFLFHKLCEIAGLSKMGEANVIKRYFVCSNFRKSDNWNSDNWQMNPPCLCSGWLSILFSDFQSPIHQFINLAYCFPNREAPCNGVAKGQGLVVKPPLVVRKFFHCVLLYYYSGTCIIHSIKRNIIVDNFFACQNCFPKLEIWYNYSFFAWQKFSILEIIGTITPFQEILATPSSHFVTNVQTRLHIGSWRHLWTVP